MQDQGDRSGGFDRDRGDRGFGNDRGGDDQLPYEERPYVPFTRNMENSDFRRDAPAPVSRPQQEDTGFRRSEIQRSNDPTIPVAAPQENTGFRRSEIQRSDDPVQAPVEQPTANLGGWRSSNTAYVSPTKQEAAASSGPRQNRF